MRGVTFHRPRLAGLNGKGPLNENLRALHRAVAGGGYRAPVQRVEDFLAKRPSKKWGQVVPSYLPGATPAPTCGTPCRNSSAKGSARAWRSSNGGSAISPTRTPC